MVYFPLTLPSPPLGKEGKNQKNSVCYWIWQVCLGFLFGLIARTLPDTIGVGGIFYSRR